MARWARHTSVLALVAVGMLMASHDASAQTNRRTIDRDLSLPSLGPNQLRVVPPTPEVQVVDDDEEGDSPSSRRRDPRRVPSIERPPTDRDTRRPPPRRDPPARESSSRQQRSSERSSGSSGGASPTPQTFRRAVGEEPDDSGPVEYGRLIVMTQFDNVRVTVAGEPYPWGSMDGVLLFAGEQYDVIFSQAESEGSNSSSEEQGRVVTVRVAAGETRVLLANLGTGTVSRPQQSSSRNRSRSSRNRDTSRDDEEEEIGYLGVSSSPRGTVYVDGENTGQTTPARRIELEPGRHEVRIFYESEERFSETKNVLIRDGVNTNVFFRLRRDEDEEDEDD